MAVDEPEPNQDQPTVIPDALGTVTGWRAWRWNKKTLRLDPMVIRIAGCWDPDKEISRARCVVYDNLDLIHPSLHPYVHSVPSEGCDCGIYATKQPTAAYGVIRRGTIVGPPDWSLRVGRRTFGFKEDDIVLGRVEMWGHVIEYKKGYRAEFARITDIVDSSPASRAAAARYDVPLSDPRVTARWYHYLIVWILALWVLAVFSVDTPQFVLDPSVGNGFDVALDMFYAFLWMKLGLLPPRLRYYLPCRSGVHHDHD